MDAGPKTDFEYFNENLFSSKEAVNWEVVLNSNGLLERLMVYGGWLIKHTKRNYESPPVISISFMPDMQHVWVLKENRYNG